MRYILCQCGVGSNSADLFTKNLDGKTYDKHARVNMGDYFLRGDDITAQEEECQG